MNKPAHYLIQIVDKDNEMWYKVSYFPSSELAEHEVVSIINEMDNVKNVFLSRLIDEKILVGGKFEKL